MIKKIYNYILAGLKLIKTKNYNLLFNKIIKILKLQVYSLIYYIKKKNIINAKIEVLTENPVAYKSPDHIVPTGTKNDNNTNKIFVIKINNILKKKFPNHNLSILDLGCAGGSMINDFVNLGYLAVGLEGSDFSLKHKRASWEKLSNKNLFTCDITKDYQIYINGVPHLFNCITAWEVMEHINKKDLYNTFKMINKHLIIGGYFIFSTTHTSDIRNGIELHQTQMKTNEWIDWITTNFPNLKIYNINLNEEEFVRQGTNKTICLIKTQ